MDRMRPSSSLSHFGTIFLNTDQKYTTWDWLECLQKLRAPSFGMHEFDLHLSVLLGHSVRIVLILLFLLLNGVPSPWTPLLTCTKPWANSKLATYPSILLSRPSRVSLVFQGLMSSEFSLHSSLLWIHSTFLFKSQESIFQCKHLLCWKLIEWLFTSRFDTLILLLQELRPDSSRIGYKTLRLQAESSYLASRVILTICVQATHRSQDSQSTSICLEHNAVLHSTSLASMHEPECVLRVRLRFKQYPRTFNAFWCAWFDAARNSTTDLLQLKQVQSRCRDTLRSLLNHELSALRMESDEHALHLLETRFEKCIKSKSYRSTASVGSQRFPRAGSDGHNRFLLQIFDKEDNGLIVREAPCANIVSGTRVGKLLARCKAMQTSESLQGSKVVLLKAFQDALYNIFDGPTSSGHPEHGR
ncbi:hypothetical protein B0H15DRAFT_933699 [Mycena belliarum]|uniref:Uncharacterized protein n=1 Tax=Mycena belliarum TaxID=1033014 RepID=A0AAD6TT21_9AGAR|nr:hypothetical protein B0H15DRAFT_933699 [Mycena belliae]